MRMIDASKNFVNTLMLCSVGMFLCVVFDGIIDAESAEKMQNQIERVTFFVSNQNAVNWIEAGSSVGIFITSVFFLVIGTTNLADVTFKHLSDESNN